MTSSARGHARHDVLARRGRGGDDGVVVAHQPDDQRRHLLGQLVAELRRVGEQNLGCAVELGGASATALAVGAGDQHMHVLAQRLGGAHGLGDGRRRAPCCRARPARRTVMTSAPASFSLATSSAALATLTPALRPGGSTVLSTLRRGAMSTPIVGRLLDVERLLLRLHDVGQRRIARLVEAQVGGDDGRQLELQRLEPAVDLARDERRLALDHELGGEGGLRPAEQRRQHLAGLVAVIVDRLLAEDDEARLSASTTPLSSLATASGSIAWPSGVSIRRPRSAPIDRAVRIVSCDLRGRRRRRRSPGDLPFSFSRTTSSTAISSKGFIDILTLASSTPDPSDLTRILTLKSTTRLTATSTFIPQGAPSEARARTSRSSRAALRSSVLPHRGILCLSLWRQRMATLRKCEMET